MRIRIRSSVVKRVERDDDRQPANELRDQPVLQQVVMVDIRQQRAFATLLDQTRRVHRNRIAPSRAQTACRRSRPGPRTRHRQMKRMLRVSIWMYSWCGCLRPLCGGTLATVPSMIFSSACCTPSPETSRVIDGVVGLARDLVDLIDVDDAGLGAGRHRRHSGSSAAGCSPHPRRRSLPRSGRWHRRSRTARSRILASV